MKQNPEQLLQQFRLPLPSTELRARILAAARQEWDKPSPASEWAPLKRPLLAVAAALVLLAAGNWTNQRLTAPGAVASAPPAPASPWISVEMAGLPAPLYVHSRGGSTDPRATRAALQSRQTQMRELLAPTPAPQPAPAPNGQTRRKRQNGFWIASCC